MRNARAIVALVGLLAGMSAGFTPHGAQAQDVLDPTEVYETGLLLDDEVTYQSVRPAPTTRAFLPESVDLKSNMPPVGDQGRQGSCVAWATGYAARSYYVSSLDGKDVRRRQNVPSPAFIYDSITDTPGNCHTGTSIYDALILLQKGVPSLKDFPYDQNYCDAPTKEQKEAARDFKIGGFVRVDTNDLDQIKGELAQGNPVIVAIETSLPFHRMKAGDVYTTPSTEHVGYHAVTIVGYDEDKRTFKLINSWGTKWADKGYGQVSYDLFPTIARQAYVIRMPKAPPTPVVPEPIQVDPQPRPSPLPDVKLPSVTCGSLTLKDNVVAGYVGDQAEFDAAAAYAKEIGATFAVDFRPWPQCEALNTLKANLETPDAPAIMGPNVRSLRAGDGLVFELETPDYTGFLHVAYIQADGSVLNLIQSPAGALKQYPPHTKVTLGDGSGGLPKFTVGPPFGKEMLVVVSSPSPLFATAQPAQETERAFLSELRSALVLHRANAKGDVPGAAIVTVNTAQ